MDITFQYWILVLEMYCSENLLVELANLLVGLAEIAFYYNNVRKFARRVWVRYNELRRKSKLKYLYINYCQQWKL